MEAPLYILEKANLGLSMTGIDLSNIENATSELLALSDDDLRQLKFTMPWETLEDSRVSEDSDGFVGSGLGLRNKLQEACWEKFNKNPQVSTAVRGHVGRLTGMGFEASSEIPKIQDVIDEVEFDPRNRLYTHWPKFVGRSIIEGELYLGLTLHNDGFIEVDFIDPGDIQGGGEDGIIYHPYKSTMPLFYFVKQVNAETGINGSVLVPSIFIARYPELIKIAQGLTSFKGAMSTLKSSMTTGPKYKKVGGFRRFIVSWDKSFMTKRNVSHLRTILEIYGYPLIEYSRESGYHCFQEEDAAPKIVPQEPLKVCNLVGYPICHRPTRCFY